MDSSPEGLLAGRLAQKVKELEGLDPPPCLAQPLRSGFHLA